MTEPLDITMAATKLLDENIQPVAKTHDQEVQIVNSAAEMLRHRAPIEDMDDEASNFVTWLGSLHKDIMLYGLQRIFKPTPLPVVYEDKAKARIDTMQDQLDNTTGYVAANFETIDHHAWPPVHLDGTTQEERVKDYLMEQFKERVAGMPTWVTADMVLNGIGHDEELSISDTYALATGVVYDLRDYFEATKGKKPNSVEHKVLYEKVDNFLGWTLKINPEVAIFAGRTALAIFRITFDPAGMKNFDKWSDTYQDLLFLG